MARMWVCGGIVPSRHPTRVTGSRVVYYRVADNNTPCWNSGHHAGAFCAGVGWPYCGRGRLWHTDTMAGL